MNRIASLLAITALFAPMPALAQGCSQDERDARIAVASSVRDCVLKNVSILARQSKERPNDVVTAAMSYCEKGFAMVGRFCGGEHFEGLLREKLREEAVATVVRRRI